MSDALAAAHRLLNAMNLADDSLADFEADVQLVAEAVVERAETEGRLRAALEAMTASSDDLLRERDQYMDRVGMMIPALMSIVQILGTHGDRPHPACMTEALRVARAALAPTPAVPEATINRKNEVCGCGDLPISHASGPCIINGCECPGYTSWRNMPAWWHRDHGTMRPLAPPTASAAPHDAGEGA